LEAYQTMPFSILEIIHRLKDFTIGTLAFISKKIAVALMIWKK